MEGARERRRNEGNGRVGAMGEERPESFLLPRPIYPLPAARILYAGEGPGWGQRPELLVLGPIIADQRGKSFMRRSAPMSVKER